MIKYDKNIQFCHRKSEGMQARERKVLQEFESTSEGI